MTETRTTCKQCGKKHKRTKLDVMNARYVKNAFCSDFCHNLYLFNHGMVLAEEVKIPVKKGHHMKIGHSILLNDDIYPVVGVGDDWIKIRKNLEADN